MMKLESAAAPANQPTAITEKTHPDLGREHFVDGEVSLRDANQLIQRLLEPDHNLSISKEEIAEEFSLTDDQSAQFLAEIAEELKSAGEEETEAKPEEDTAEGDTADEDVTEEQPEDIEVVEIESEDVEERSIEVKVLKEPSGEVSATVLKVEHSTKETATKISVDASGITVQVLYEMEIKGRVDEEVLSKHGLGAQQETAA